MQNCCFYWRRILLKTLRFLTKNTKGLASIVSRNLSARPSFALKKRTCQPADALQLPETFRCHQRTTADKLEGLCVLLRRMSFPCRYSDMIPRFGRPVPELSMIANTVMDYIHDVHGLKLSQWNHDLLNPHCLDTYTDAISNKGAALDNCFGFIDGTVRQICRPSQNQRIVFNGHKRVHSLKFQSVTLPNGLIANLYGPVG